MRSARKFSIIAVKPGSVSQKFSIGTSSVKNGIKKLMSKNLQFIVRFTSVGSKKLVLLVSFGDFHRLKMCEKNHET